MSTEDKKETKNQLRLIDTLSYLNVLDSGNNLNYTLLKLTN